MDDKAISQLAHEIASRAILDNWQYWLLLGLIAFVLAFAASWIGTYAGKRGEFAAAKADRAKILEQLEENTRTTARINSIVSLGEWSERERRTLRRVKLEELILTAHKARDWMELESNRHVFSPDDSSDAKTASPLALVVTIGKLFFPELRPKIDAFELACKQYYLASGQIRSQLLEAKIEAVRAAATANPQEWQLDAEIRTAEAQNSIRERNGGRLLAAHNATYAALMELDEGSGTLMSEITAAAPAADN